MPTLVGLAGGFYIAVATVLTLIFLPALYVAVNGIREKDEPTGAAEPDLLATLMLAPQH